MIFDFRFGAKKEVCRQLPGRISEKGLIFIFVFGEEDGAGRGEFSISIFEEILAEGYDRECHIGKSTDEALGHARFRHDQALK